MKKIYLMLILLLSLNLQAQQVKVYNVIRVSSNDIYCGTSTTPLKEGSKINDNSIIQWKNYHQWFEAQDSYGKTRYFSKESMESRHKRTVSEYLKDLLNRCINTTSGKGVEQLLAGKNKDMYSEKRLALVIGNANYNNIVSLRNPLNDASLISGDLRDLGFDVMCLYDGTTREIEDVFEAFRQKVVNEHYDLVLFYYSGHGLKSDYKNWIVPINAKLESQTGSRYECIDGHYLLEIIKESGCSNSIVIMDACRTEVNWSKAFMQGGAISMEPEQNMLLAFSTRDYEEAKDIVPNVKGYGPYAAALSKALRTEGLTLDEIFKDVKNQVYKNTSGTQSPIHTNDVRKEIILHAKKTTTNNKTSSSTSSISTSNEKQNDVTKMSNSGESQISNKNKDMINQEEANAIEEEKRLALNCKPVTDYDGNTYKTVQIGKQCWMAENLRTTHFADGKRIKRASFIESSINPPYLRYYSDVVMRGASATNKNPSGIQGICPNGWHVPSDAEWEQLVSYVGSQKRYTNGNPNLVGKALASSSDSWKLKAATLAEILGPEDSTAVCIHTEQNNSTQFNALPDHKSEIPYVFYWTSTKCSMISEVTGSDNYFVVIDIRACCSGVVSRWSSYYGGFNPVRCVRD